MKKILTGIKIASSVFLMMFLLTSCEEFLDAMDEEGQDGEEQADDEDFGRGVEYDKEKESLKSIPKDLSLVTLSDASVSLGSRVVLKDFVPPVRSQGQYGTCTAWATGYYTRTMMYAYENDLSSAELEDDKNVFSPLDVYLSMDGRSSDCGGSWPGQAFEMMQKRGIATFATAPYENLGDCSQAPKPNWTTDAANYKIENYRTVDFSKVDKVKSYLQMGRPVQISCKLGIDFFGVNDAEVIYNGDYTSEPERDLYHAMVCVGYDDEMGANGAFLIVNSWGTNWGDGGFAWVDYEYFTKGKENNGLVYSAYVVEGDKGSLSDDKLSDPSVIDPSYRVDGKDLLAIKLDDEVSNDPLYPDDDRYLTYDVFNRGNSVIPASDDWNIVYYYYNAFNPEEDFGILIYDYYTDDVGSAYKGQMGWFEDVDVEMEVFGDQNYWNYIDVPAGMSVASAATNDGGSYNFEFGYALPDDLNGEYYFVLYTDGFDDHKEKYEQNNYMFFTGKDRKPIKINNGVVDPNSLKSVGNRHANPFELKKDNPNAYSTEEISGLIQYQKRTGILDQKAKQYLKSAPANREKSRGKRLVRVE
jgi:C1A family cysteine protease